MIIITTILTSTPQIGRLFFPFFPTSGADKTKILFYPLSLVPSGTVPLHLPPSSPPSQTSLSLEASLFCHKATRTMIMGPCFFTVFLSHTPTRSYYQRVLRAVKVSPTPIHPGIATSYFSNSVKLLLLSLTVLICKMVMLILPSSQSCRVSEDSKWLLILCYFCCQWRRT